MFTQSIIVMLVVYLAGAVISFFVASLIKAIFMGIRLRETRKAGSARNWKKVPQVNH